MYFGYAVLRTALLVLCTSYARALLITVDAHSEECFHDEATSGTKMRLTFEVAEGGFLDIDVKITGPDGRTVYSGVRESSGKYTFSAYADGVYHYCFSNAMSTLTPKTLMFTMELGEAPKKGQEGEEVHETKLEEMINELTAAMTSVKHEQEYMIVRDEIHSSISETTNSRVMWWAFYEAIVLLVMTMGQLYYLTAFFEVRRIV